jgi:glycosyltransferase involved in cell wall biosynthesis
MKFVFVSYNYSADINTPEAWINRINFYVGSLECLSKTNTVIRVDQINYEGDFIHNGVQYFCIKPKKKKNYFPRKLNRFVRSLAPDVVVVSSFLFPLQVIQLRLCLGKKIKIIVQHHAEKPYSGIKKFIQRQASRFIDAYIFASYEIGADWVKRGNLINEKKIHEIVGGTSVFYPIEKSIAKQKTEVEGSVVFLWAGRFNANKDPLTVIKAFLKFAAMQPGVKLYMIYQTTELLNDVKSLIAENKNSKDRIVLIGPVQHSEMLYWLNSADFLVSGSHYEGSGTVICEAMSCGCIPVVTDIHSFRSITDNGECGLLYSPGNEDELFSLLMKTMIMNLDDMQNRILEHFKNELSFEAIARKINKVAADL